MEHSINTTWIGDFRDRLRGTWVHHVFDGLRNAQRGLLRQSHFTQLTDKYSARAYVASKVGEEYLVKLMAWGRTPRAIPFDSLSAEYVIKPNHASQRVIVADGYAARDDIVGEVSGWLSSNYYWAAREYQYYRIKPRIMIEECLRAQDGSLPLDYKVWCFNECPSSFK